ncbi:unnamed protein product (macronuclear) [Paramecium tetraurelia]|uniref:Uncharacterized protein n=1 Tax=Paramecium tetraurelia TaxID=5888 RepID=A0DLB7_PARTE|nr:uncharacterized protein GSPATT00018151001 [Paramecium tetraurelia]CAK83834.1 unnamed protein product [Paramecium tetraurelia]|eukprot:XP_001451231.1 hypothetical protein (macronuclear) [Paramecium tetraurelia strain d4-2]
MKFPKVIMLRNGNLYDEDFWVCLLQLKFNAMICLAVESRMLLQKKNEIKPISQNFNSSNRSNNDKDNQEFKQQQFILIQVNFCIKMGLFASYFSN